MILTKVTVDILRQQASAGDRETANRVSSVSTTEGATVDLPRRGHFSWAAVLRLVFLRRVRV